MYSMKDNSFLPTGPLSLGIELVYYSPDIEKTLAWFDDILGWLTQVDRRDDNNQAVHGIAYTVPLQYFSNKFSSNIKIHIFSGEPAKGVISFIPTTKLEKLVAFANRKKDCGCHCAVNQSEDGTLYTHLKTIDGSVLTFYQENDLG
ncbi:hypothetical protein ACYSNR_15395 [Enterococcus sp. LJL128]|uniref:hypothetical protein n=1 Tax=Enterococcus sp. LJL51 TaxID=3416656 RepID=UPI003CF410E3